MKFGVMNLFPLAEGQSQRLVYEETLDEAALADDLGFDSFWLAEHHFSTYGVLGNPLMFGAAVAERTKRIKIGTAVMVIPFYDPVRLAEDAALLDNISGGRLMLGTATMRSSMFCVYPGPKTFGLTTENFSPTKTCRSIHGRFKIQCQSCTRQSHLTRLSVWGRWVNA